MNREAPPLSTSNNPILVKRIILGMVGGKQGKSRRGSRPLLTEVQYLVRRSILREGELIDQLLGITILRTC